MTSEILSQIVDLINANFMLVELDLSDNFLTDDCLGDVERIVENCTHLRSINLSKNKFVGTKAPFFHFFDVVNLLQDSLVDGVDELGFMLNFSQNEISDDIVEAVEQLFLFCNASAITHLDLSFNLLNKASLWRLYKGFVTALTKNRAENKQTQIILNIFPLPFHQDIIKDSIIIYKKMDSDKKR